MLRGIGVAIVMLTVAATYGCAQQSRAAVVVEDKTYALTPATVTVKAGVVTGAMSDNESVRLIGAKIFYLDGQGRPMNLEDSRTAPILKLDGYGAERLDPGQEATQAVDVEFPAAALKAKSLKDIRLELTYIQSPYKAEAVTFAVTIAEPK